MEEKKEDFKIVNGDGKDLNISEVYDHLNPGKPKCGKEKPKDIVIPEEKHKKTSKE